MEPITLERLIERHMALTESVESLNHSVARQSQIVERLIEATNSNTQNIASLVGIIEGHEHRLERLEGDSPSN